MTAHTHLTIIPGCYRCEIGRDEAAYAERLDQIATALASPYAHLCAGLVIRDGDEDACEKPTTCVIVDPEHGPWVACVWHAHRYGSGRMVTLAEIWEALR